MKCARLVRLRLTSAWIQLTFTVVEYKAYHPLACLGRIAMRRIHSLVLVLVTHFCAHHVPRSRAGQKSAQQKSQRAVLPLLRCLSTSCVLTVFRKKHVSGHKHIPSYIQEILIFLVLSHWNHWIWAIEAIVASYIFLIHCIDVYNLRRSYIVLCRL